MKVYVTQGHEKGIGLEVFFKSCLFLSHEDLGHIKLLAYKESVSNTLKPLKLPYKIHDDAIDISGTHIPVQWLQDINHSQSFTALDLGMKLAETGHILYTLPTSKDQFPGFAGHTEYFRAFYKRSDLGMFFSAPDLKVLLISDHIALKDVPATLTASLIEQRLHEALTALQNWQWPISKVLIAGFNPHAGEGGLIGNEDERVKLTIKRLSSKFEIDMSGPLPGDTMLMEKKSPQDLLVYLYHDQGLGVFKGLQGFIGSNITLGLPYPRFSPDHGTSFKTFGMNQADYRGCAYSLKEALSLGQRISRGKNSSYQSQSSQSKKY